MKLLVVCLVLVQLSLAVVRADVPGTFVNRTLLAMQPAATYSEMCDGHQYYATCGSNMCEEVQICAGQSTHYRYCRMMNPSKPFCNNGECSNTPVFSSSCLPNPISCQGSGWFPDPFSCSLYHYCEGLWYSSDVYQCPEGHVFNPETLLCKPRLSEADCMKLDCDPDHAFAQYGTSKRFFGFCYYSMGDQFYDVYMYRCPQGSEFTGRGCVFRCAAEGRFPDSTNPNIYYECVEDLDGTLSAITRICPSGKVFDATKTACVTAPPVTTKAP